LTGARLAAEALEAALVRVRPGRVRRTGQGAEPLIVHQADEELAERLAARDELVARLAELVAGWNRRDGDLEAARAVGRELARGQQLLDRDHLLAGLGAAPQVGLPGGLQRAGLGIPRRAVARVDVRRGRVHDCRAARPQFRGDGVHHRRDLALAREADEALPQRTDAR